MVEYRVVRFRKVDLESRHNQLMFSLYHYYCILSRSIAGQRRHHAPPSQGIDSDGRQGSTDTLTTRTSRT